MQQQCSNIAMVPSLDACRMWLERNKNGVRLNAECISDAARVQPECSELNAGMLLEYCHNAARLQLDCSYIETFVHEPCSQDAARLQSECCRSAARTYIQTWIEKKGNFQHEDIAIMLQNSSCIAAVTQPECTGNASRTKEDCIQTVAGMQRECIHEHV